MSLYLVRYSAGTYEGTKSVNATDDEEAIAKVRCWVRREMVVPMYSDSYAIESVTTEPIEAES